MSVLHFFNQNESMPGCVVQDCGNESNEDLGISVHNSPALGPVSLCPGWRVIHFVPSPVASCMTSSQKSISLQQMHS